MLGDAIQWQLQVFVDIVAQGFQRRHIEHLDTFMQTAIHAILYQAVDGGVERGQGLTTASWGADERVASSLNRGPGLGLSGSRFTKL